MLEFFRKRWAVDASDSGRAGAGLIYGAVVASLMFPTSGLMTALVYGAYVDRWREPHGMATVHAVVLGVGLVGIYFLAFTICWAIGIALLMPVWHFIFWCGARGPRAAATLGAVASVGLALAVPPLQILVWFVPTKLLYLGSMAATGAIGGSVVWWTAYQPQAVQARLRRCPLCRVCA